MEQQILKCPSCKQDVIAENQPGITAIYCNYCKSRIVLEQK